METFLLKLNVLRSIKKDWNTFCSSQHVSIQRSPFIINQ